MPDIQLGNVTLYYETTGQGPPLLFMNGLGMSVRDWERQAAYFSKDYQVITFDFRGQGKSGKPPGPYSIPLFCGDAAGLLRSMGVWPAHLVGLSMGGMVAFQMAVSCPELVRTMVIANSGPEFILRTLRQKFEFLKREFIVRVLGMRAMTKILAGRLFPEKGQEELRRQMEKNWAQNDRRAYIESFLALKGWTVSEYLEGIRCPTLVVTADMDYTPVSFKQAYADRIQGAELAVISNSRHGSPMDQPDRFNQIVYEFLRKHE